jgi:hypothetical protein
LKKLLLLAAVLALASLAAVASAGPHDIWPPTVDEVRTSGPGPF